MQQGFPIVSLAIWSLLLAPAAWGQDGDPSDTSVLGGPKISLNLRSVAFYTDNFYNQPNGQTDTIGGLVNPQFKVLTHSAKVNFDAVLEAEYGAFDLPGSEDDYLDSGATANLSFRPTVRNQLRLAAGFKQGHDAFGVDRTEDVTVRDTELDIWNQTTGSLHYRYGAPGAKLNAEVGARAMKKEYATNESSTRALDHDSTSGEYTLFYNYSPKTAALIDFSRTDITFDQPFGGVDRRSGEAYRARVGMRWLATGKTSGDVRVGYRRRVFDDDSPDIEGPDWEAGVDWAPVPRSSLRLATAHSEQPSYRSDTRVIEIDSLQLDWRHNLSARLRSTVGMQLIHAEFDPIAGSTTSQREDDIVGATAGGEYLAMSYLWVVGTVGINQRDSTLADREYDRLNAYVGIRLGR